MCKIREHAELLQNQSRFFTNLTGLLCVHVQLFVLPRYPDSNSVVIRHHRADPGFSEGLSESRVNIEGVANPSIVSLK